MTQKEIQEGITETVGTFHPFVPNYGYHQWKLKGERDKYLADYLMLRHNQGRFISNDYSTPLSEDLRVDAEHPDVSSAVEEIMSHIKTVNPKLKLMTNQFGQPEIWGQVNMKGGSTAMHKHEDCFAFVYYVNAPVDGGMLKFYINYDTMSHVCTTEPASKCLLFFPGWVPHFTMRNQSDSPRIVLSGNVIFGD
tara:strand:+ start:4171 stop:4749 length:579 start_codon:yes stop_codon:yes gene_type:complete